MQTLRSILITIIVIFVGTALQGCDPVTGRDPIDSTGDDPCDKKPSVIRQLSEEWDLQDLLVDSGLNVYVEGPVNNSKPLLDRWGNLDRFGTAKPFGNYTGCVRDSVVDSRTIPIGHGTGQLLALTLSAESSSAASSATVYGLPLSQIYARSGSTVHANFQLLGRTYIPLKIKASEASTVLVGNTQAVGNAEIVADNSKIDLGTFISGKFKIRALNGGSVIGTIGVQNHSRYTHVEIACESGGRINISYVPTWFEGIELVSGGQWRSGPVEQKVCGGETLLLP